MYFCDVIMYICIILYYLLISKGGFMKKNMFLWVILIIPILFVSCKDDDADFLVKDNRAKIMEIMDSQNFQSIGINTEYNNNEYYYFEKKDIVFGDRFLIATEGEHTIYRNYIQLSSIRIEKLNSGYSNTNIYGLYLNFSN